MAWSSPTLQFSGRAGKLLVWKRRQIHAQVLKTYFHDDRFVSNSILWMYLGLGEIEIARRVFDRMPHRDVISWNSMISGCFKAGESGLACRVFAEMPHKDLVSINTMVDGLMKCGSCHLAMQLFENLPDRDVVTWTSMISSYVLNGVPENALEIFREMLCSCHKRRVGDWISMMLGFAFHGLGQETLNLFHEMQRMRVNLDEVTFLAILNACRHSGLVGEGLHYFQLMNEKFKIKPRIKDYGFLIDLLGRAGWLEHAHRIIDEMPMEPDSMVWKSLLSSCVKHKSLAIGEFAVMNAIELAPQDSTCYVLLSNLYAKAGKWSDVDSI